MATYSSFLPGEFHGQRSLVQSMGSERVGHDWATNTFTAQYKTQILGKYFFCVTTNNDGHYD